MPTAQADGSRDLVRILALVAGSIACACSAAGAASTRAAAHASPASDVAPPAPARAPMRPISTNYSGTRVIDAYRYLEDPGDPATQSFVRDRDVYASAILGRLDPTRSALRRRIGVLGHGMTKIDDLVRVGDRFFYIRHAPNDHNDVLCVRDASGANERVLIDPAEGVPAGANATIESFLPSNDGRFVAYTLSLGNSESAELHVLDTATATDLPEAARDVRTGGATAWSNDGGAFIYDRYPPLLDRHDPREELRRPIAYRHILGRTTTQDTPVFGNGVDGDVPFLQDDLPIVRLVAGSPYAVGLIRHGVTRDLTVYVTTAASLNTSRAVWKRAADTGDGVVDVAFSASTLFLLDHKNGSGREVRAVPLAAPDLATAVTIVPPSPDVIDGFAIASDALYVRARRGYAGKIVRVPLGSDGIFRGTPETLALPRMGAVLGLAADPGLPGVIASVGSWLAPTRVFDFEPGDAAVDTQLGGRANAAVTGLRVADEETARSADGTLVPITIIHDATLPRDGRRPAIVEAYGAYGTTLLPEYDPARGPWMEHGGVFAICHVRGGGWYGDAWHRAAVLDRKGRSVDDVIACADHLVKRGYTAPAHLAGLTFGAGGLALGGAIVRRPNLFAAAIELAATSDPIRGQFTATGPGDALEFGTTESAAGTAALLAMSPYAHLSDLTAYPATFLEAGTGDDGIAPWQAAKFAARLEVAQAAARPILLRSSEPAADLAADALAFALWQTGDTGFGFVPTNVPGPVGTRASQPKRAATH